MGPLLFPRPRMNFLSLGQGLKKMGEQQYPYQSGDLDMPNDLP